MALTDDEEKAIRQKLKNNLEHYALKCLKIRTKSGAIHPFVFNKAQKYIHQQLENQRGATGKVRALILKGRQQGCCLSPDSKVLTSDYRWVSLDDVRVGDKLVACDEDGIGFSANGRKQSRKFRTTIVEHKAEFIKDVLEILFDNGARLVLTLDHRMLSKQRGGTYQVWRCGEDFIIGDQIRVVARPPLYEYDFEDRWIGRMIEGEGLWDGKKGATRMSIHEHDGPVLERIKKYFDNIDMPYCEVVNAKQAAKAKKPRGNIIHRVDIHRIPYIIELLARTRRARLVDRDWHSGRELPGKSTKDGIKPWAKIISIKSLGKQRVIDIQTSEKTFIVDGLVSHNSTYVGARFYHKVTHRLGAQAFILTHALDATANLFKMAKRFYENTPDVVRPAVSTSNTKELIFGELDSGYKLGTAENKNVGRSSTIQLLHGSEIGFWNNASDHATGIMQAVPNASDTEIIMESTANGVGNYFHQMWQSAEAGISEFIAIFVPWYWQDEYAKRAEDFKPTVEETQLKEIYKLSDEQLNWRRSKIVELAVNGIDGAKAFQQEYPLNATEAFQLTGEDSYISSDLVMRARKADLDKYGPLVLGVDPARFGDDRTGIIRRQGRMAFGLESYTKKDTMEVTGIVHSIIERERPVKVFVDVGGLGAGVVDRLCELGHRDIIVAVNAGSSALDARRYYNKRAEMWGLCRQWLEDLAQIPDDDSLHADLCGIRYKIDSNSRLVMEQKTEMKKRDVRSPDLAEALILTFAQPVSALETGSNKSLKRMAASLNAGMQAKEQLRNLK